MSKIKVIITGAGGGGANNIISTIKEREKYTLIGFDISEFNLFIKQEQKFRRCF